MALSSLSLSTRTVSRRSSTRASAMLRAASATSISRRRPSLSRSCVLMTAFFSSRLRWRSCVKTFHLSLASVRTMICRSASSARSTASRSSLMSPLICLSLRPLTSVSHVMNASTPATSNDLNLRRLFLIQRHLSIIRGPIVRSFEPRNNLTKSIELLSLLSRLNY